jgi:hypothetical protein
MNKTILIVAMIVVVLSSCNCNNNRSDLPSASTANVSAYAPAEEKIKEGVSMLREGDLVMRNSTELSSQIIREFCRTDKSYSHAGLVFFENGYPIIYHILPGDENPDEKLTRDSLLSFAAPRRNSGFAIYRYQLQSQELTELRTIVHDWYNKGVKFDSLLNLEDDDRLYCSELVYKAIKYATKGRITFDVTKATIPELHIYSKYTHVPLSEIKRNECVAMDNLKLHPSCALVKKFSFTDTAQVKVDR